MAGIPFGGIQAWAQSWGTSLLKGLVWIIGGMILTMIGIILIITIFKVCVKKVGMTMVTVQYTDTPDLFPTPDWIPPYPDSLDDDDELDDRA